MSEQPLGSPDDAAGAPAGGVESSPVRATIPAHEVGTATLSPLGSFEAGSYQTFTLVYTAGKFGIDDSGSMRICFRFASDQTRPQFDDPKRPNFSTVVASNGAVLQYHYDPKGNVRPWDRTLYIKVVKGFLREGDTITVTFGDTSQGSPGMRLQTFCEDTFEFHTLVDPIATYCYQPVPQQPVIKIVSGPPEVYLAVAPTLIETGKPFALKMKGEDRWGNPSDQCDATFTLRANGEATVTGLPSTVTFKPGEFTNIIEGLTLSSAGEAVIELLDANGDVVSESNPIRAAAALPLKHFWADLHGQSEETIGTGSAREYFEFARDMAFVDATGHQGNDFQITSPFWQELDELCEEYDAPGSFVAIPGYEWSGNTGLGGDRNMYFPEAGRTLRRSSHALVQDHSDIASDANSAAELFQALADNKEWDVVGYAHCGGRYADVKMAHDGRFEKSMEVHSSWGTFEWLVQDAFEMGYRVGIVSNSDGHKGRPGASYPGASLFGAVGGLTCFLADNLSREAILDAMRKRHHYGTTGGHGGRLFIDVQASFSETATLYNDDPNLGPSEGTASTSAIMGDIVHLPSGSAEISIDIHGMKPIERVDIFNGLEHIETVRPYPHDDLGNRIRVMWEGAEYRGRFRQVIWDGEAHLSDNRILAAKPFNFFNRDKTLDQVSETSVKWQALTTGNIGGFDLWVEDAYGGTLKIETPLVKCGVPLEEIGLEDEIFDKSDILPRYLKIFRLPTENPHRQMTFKRTLDLKDKGDNPIFIRVTQEDGTLAWTSPIYIYR